MIPLSGKSAEDQVPPAPPTQTLSGPLEPGQPVLPFLSGAADGAPSGGSVTEPLSAAPRRPSSVRHDGSPDAATSAGGTIGPIEIASDRPLTNGLPFQAAPAESPGAAPKPPPSPLPPAPSAGAEPGKSEAAAVPPRAVPPPLPVSIEEACRGMDANVEAVGRHYLESKPMELEPMKNDLAMALLNGTHTVGQRGRDNAAVAREIAALRVVAAGQGLTLGEFKWNPNIGAYVADLNKPTTKVKYAPQMGGAARTPDGVMKDAQGNELKITVNAQLKLLDGGYKELCTRAEAQGYYFAAKAKRDAVRMTNSAEAARWEQAMNALTSVWGEFEKDSRYNRR